MYFLRLEASEHSLLSNKEASKLRVATDSDEFMGKSLNLTDSFPHL